MPDEQKADDGDNGRPVIPDVGGRMGESKGVWRILLTSVTLAVVALALVGALYGFAF